MQMPLAVKLSCIAPVPAGISRWMLSVMSCEQYPSNIKHCPEEEAWSLVISLGAQ